MAREIDRLRAATLAPSDNGLVERLRAFADEAEIGIRMTAAEDVLGWLLIEKIGVPDDRNYTPNEAQATIVVALDRAKAAESHAAALETLLDKAVEKEKHSFQVGYTLAVANLINLHDQPGMAADVMAQSGISFADIAEMDLTDYDLTPLREMFQEEGVLRVTAIQEARHADR